MGAGGADQSGGPGLACDRSCAGGDASRNRPVRGLPGRTSGDGDRSTRRPAGPARKPADGAVADAARAGIGDRGGARHLAAALPGAGPGHGARQPRDPQHRRRAGYGGTLRLPGRAQPRVARAFARRRARATGGGRSGARQPPHGDRRAGAAVADRAAGPHRADAGVPGGPGPVGGAVLGRRLACPGCRGVLPPGGIDEPVE